MATENDEIERESIDAPDAITDNQHVEIEVSDDEDDGDDESPSTETERPSRKERRKARGSEHRARLEEKVRETEARYAALEAQLRALQSAPVQRYEAPAPQRTGPSEAQEVWEQQKQLMDYLGRVKLSPEEEKAQVDKWAALDRKRRRLEAIEDGYAFDPSKVPQIDPVAIERTMLESEFPEVFQNINAKNAAQQEMAQLVAQGKKPSFATARLAAKRVMERMGLGGGSEVSDAQKARYGGVSSRPGASGGGGGKVRATPDQVKMARAYARGRASDDKEAFEIWYKEVGKHVK